MANDRPDNEVGFGKPPRRTQFKPGQSGNPTGRPRGSKNLATVLRAALREPVVVTENGRRRRVTKLEAATKQLVNKAASADLAAMKLLVSLLQLAESSAGSEPKPALREADHKVMQTLYQRLRNFKVED